MLASKSSHAAYITQKLSTSQKTQIISVSPPTPPSRLTSHDPGQLITLMLPLLMMRHRRIPRSRWKDRHTASGKHWIEQVRLPPSPPSPIQPHPRPKKT